MVDEDVVVDRLRHIHEYTKDLEDMRDVSKAHYVEDVVLQRAVERTFMNLIQACVDLAQHIRAEEGFSPGGTGKEEIEALENAGIITSETGEKIERRPSASETSSPIGTETSITTWCTRYCRRTWFGSSAFNVT